MNENSIIWFDATCLLCNRSVHFILQHDPEGFFQLGALPEKVAVTDGAVSPGSIILELGGKTYRESTAVLLILRHLNTPLRHLYWLIWIPKSIRDFFYRIIARNRYRWFGRTESCPYMDGKYAGRFIGKSS